MIKKIGIEELSVGMRICGVKKESAEASFFENDILIKTTEDVARLRRSGCVEAYIDTDTCGDEPPSGEPFPKPEPEPEVEVEGTLEEPLEESLEEPGEVPDGLGEEPGGGLPEEDPVGFEEELKAAIGIRAEAEAAVGELLRDARSGRSIDKDKVHETVGNIMDSVFRNRDAITSLARLKSYDRYTFTHSINVCILSTTLGRWLGMDKADIYSLGVGSILHDIGKMLVPEWLLNKRGGYTEEEFRSMQKHTVLGADFLSGTGGVDESSLRVVAHHHERYDGTGYPAGFSGEDINFFARVVAIVDVYDAMTSDRVYRRRIIPSEVLKFMYLKKDPHFGPGLLEKFIQCIGIYPIGSLVELNTGEVALIRSVNRSDLLKPQVLIVLDRGKRPYSTPVIVDLRKDEARSITCALDPDSHPVNFDEYLL